MQTFYEYLKESSSSGTISELCNKFINNVKTNVATDKFLPMIILADYIQENLNNSYKSEQIRNFVQHEDMVNLGMAANKYLETGFFTFNHAYNDTIHPMLLTFHSGYPYYMLTYKIDDRGLKVDMASLAYIRNEIVQEAKSKQMGITQYLREVYDSDNRIEELVNFENANLELYWHERKRNITNIVLPNNTIKQGDSDINESMNERFLTERLPEEVGEEVARGNYHIINDMEFYHVR